MANSLSPEQLALLRELVAEAEGRHRELVREECKASLAAFIRHGWHVYESAPLIWGWHLDEVCRLVQLMGEELLRARRDPDYVMREQNLLINIPPRSSKTLIVQVFFVAWLWLHDPSIKIRCLSGTPAVVNDAARDCLEFIESEWFKAHFGDTVKIARAANPAITNFRTTAGGERKAAGVLAKHTGVGSDVIIMDDPHDAAEADSEVQRTRTLQKWRAIRNRTNHARARLRLGIMQRLHELDWSGHVLQGSEFVHVKIPMEFEADEWCKCATHSGKRETDPEFLVRDPRTVDGELMQPERFSAEFCEAEKSPENLGAYGWAGQMQQRPSPDDGGLFAKSGWRFWCTGTALTDAAGVSVSHASAPETRPRGCYQGPARPLPDKLHEIVISVDTTFGSETNTSDYVAMYVIGRVNADRYILDRVHGRMDYSTAKARFTELCKRWPTAFRKFVEKAASGLPMITELNGVVGGVIPFTPAEHGNKVQRANVMTATQNAGNWYLPEGAVWLDPHVHEFSTFPNAAHDDCVDACSQAEIGFRLSANAALLVAAYG